MSVFHAFILGIVEGFTEFLPISSTAHLALSSKLLGISQSEFVKSFEIIIQFGAILAVVYLYWATIWQKKEILYKIAAAFVPTGIIGLLLYKIIKNVFLESYTLMIWSLLLGGAALVAFEMIWGKKAKDTSEISSLEKISYTQSILIGSFQGLAVVPGVSRAAATIVGGLILGVDRKSIVEFSFILAVPTMLFASVYDLYKNGANFERGDILSLSLGFVVSFVVALLSIKFLLNFIRRYNFIPFGIYRIIFALIFLLFLL